MENIKVKIPKSWRYIAKDANGRWWHFISEPKKDNKCWYLYDGSCTVYEQIYNKNIFTFPDVYWKDSLYKRVGPYEWEHVEQSPKYSISFEKDTIKDTPRIKFVGGPVDGLSIPMSGNLDPIYKVPTLNSSGLMKPMAEYHLAKHEDSDYFYYFVREIV